MKIHLPSLKGQSPLKTIAGGSVANTIRGLASGFGVTCGIIGACGDDEQGKLFMDNMNFNNVNLSNLKIKKGATAQVSTPETCFLMSVCTSYYSRNLFLIRFRDITV